MTRNNLLRLALLLACAAPGAAYAQTAYLQHSGIVGEGKTIFIDRLPVVSPAGTISYYNGAISLTFNASGTPVIGGHPFTLSPPVATDGFIAGRYYVKYGSAATQFGTLSYGTGAGGSTIWTLIMDVPADGAFPDQAVWQTGHPEPTVSTRLTAAKVQLDPNASYGLVTVGDHYGDAFGSDNGLLAAEQVGNNLVLTSFTDTNGTDHSLGQASITLGLCADAACSNAPK